MLKKFLNLSAVGLCRVVAKRPSPSQLLMRTYASIDPQYTGNSFSTDQEDNGNKYTVEPEANANQIVVYSYPIPHRKSLVRLLQEVNQEEKLLKEAKSEEQSMMPQELKGVPAKRQTKDAKCKEKEQSVDSTNAVPKFERLKFEGNVPYRKPKTEHGIKYEKVSAAVRMNRLDKKS
ncbi:uncharacterized protein LOC117586996 [Drosophila guanche]|uniref:Uncharacterized protein n=1 Tax=Drosophila guanche TaxID=7266 RepID=A0A3B0KNP3_DROGU|nr:uncharacterized protein LOC117586996 [Drosophila guanche]SPP85448.1 Hypothetical predicted protein [Drosophila guanche]